MPRLQHVVIYSDDPRKAAEFYEKLGLTKIIDGEELYGPVIGFSDGFVNWTLLPTGGAHDRKDGREPGVDHLGFVVDDLASSSAAVESTGAPKHQQEIPKEVLESLRESDLPPGSAQVTYVDRDGVRIELATKSWPA
jgi:catechol 2,3-dioxygenase-like lactoylglutathione lyase family enzyme